MDALIGMILDETYRITGFVGKGGMGVVYKAWDVMLDKEVAIKMLKQDSVPNDAVLKLFQREPKAQARLQHSNIVNVYTFKKSHIGFYIVMEFVEGTDLASIIQQSGPLSIPETKRIFKQLLDAFGFAHSKRVIHRDIKPSNIMLGVDGVVKVTDFGLAKIEQSADGTQTIGMGGTPYYMSPEQVRGLGNVDNRGDIYSLGMTLYETVVGRLPFDEASSTFTILQAITEGNIPSPQTLKADLPVDIVSVIRKAIHPDRDKRFQSAEEMSMALEKCGGPNTGSDTSTVVVGSGTKSIKAALMGLTVFAVLAVLGFGVWTYFDSRPGSVASPPTSENEDDKPVTAKDSAIIEYQRDSTDTQPDTMGLKQSTPTPQTNDLRELASLLVSGLKKKVTGSPTVVVMPFTMRDNQSAGSFSPFLKTLLEDKLVDDSWPVVAMQNVDPRSGEISDAFVKAAGASHILTGKYWEENASVICRAEVIRANGRVRIASTEAGVSAQVLKNMNLRLRPPNYGQILKDESLIEKNEIKNKGLDLTVWTNRGAENLVFLEGDTMQVYVRANRPCYVRLIYHLADGKRVLLLDREKIDSAFVNRRYAIDGRFVCRPPFGVEMLHLFARTEPFDPIETENMGGFAFLKQDLEEALLATRGMQSVAGVLQNEARLTITTMEAPQ